MGALGRHGAIAWRHAAVSRSRQPRLLLHRNRSRINVNAKQKRDKAQQQECLEDGDLCEPRRRQAEPDRHASNHRPLRSDPSGGLGFGRLLPTSSRAEAGAGQHQPREIIEPHTHEGARRNEAPLQGPQLLTR